MDTFNLTLQQKINVLKNIDWENMMIYRDGLCHVIKDELPESSRPASEIIDLLTYKNSKKFRLYSREDGGNGFWENRLHKKGYWFYRTAEGYQERRQFVNWMIRKYEIRLRREERLQKFITNIKNFFKHDKAS